MHDAHQQQIDRARAEQRELERAINTLIVRLQQIEDALAVDGPTVEGSRGQIRPHPLLATEGRLRGELERAHNRQRKLAEDVFQLEQLRETRERVDRINAMLRTAAAPA